MGAKQSSVSPHQLLSLNDKTEIVHELKLIRGWIRCHSIDNSAVNRISNLTFAFYFINDTQLQGWHMPNPNKHVAIEGTLNETCYNYGSVSNTTFICVNQLFDKGIHHWKFSIYYLNTPDYVLISNLNTPDYLNTDYGFSTALKHYNKESIWSYDNFAVSIQSTEDDSDDKCNIYQPFKPYSTKTTLLLYANFDTGNIIIEYNNNRSEFVSRAKNKTYTIGVYICKNQAIQMISYTDISQWMSKLNVYPMLCELVNVADFILDNDAKLLCYQMAIEKFGTTQCSKENTLLQKGYIFCAVYYWELSDFDSLYKCLIKVQKTNMVRSAQMQEIIGTMTMVCVNNKSNKTIWNNSANIRSLLSLLSAKTIAKYKLYNYAAEVLYKNDSDLVFKYHSMEPNKDIKYVHYTALMKEGNISDRLLQKCYVFCLNYLCKKKCFDQSFEYVLKLNKTLKIKTIRNSIRAMKNYFLTLSESSQTESESMKVSQELFVSGLRRIECKEYKFQCPMDLIRLIWIYVGKKEFKINFLSELLYG